MDVPDTVMYGLIGGFGLIVLTGIVLVICLMIRRRDEQLEELEYQLEKAREPPDEDDYRRRRPEPPPPPQPPQPCDPGLILIPPVLAPLPPVDYAVDVQADGAPLPTPEAFVIPAGPDLRPPPAPQPPPPPPPQPQPEDDEDLILEIEKDKKKKKKKRQRKDSSSSSSSSSSDSSFGYDPYAMTPSFMMLVQPPPQPQPVPQQIAMVSPVQPAASRGTEDQTQHAIVGVIQAPCSGPCF